MNLLLPPPQDATPSFLFLDIDGVLLPFGSEKNNPDQHFPKSTLHAFNRILKEVPRVQLVLSSTWRCGGGQRAIIAEFAQSNLFPLSTVTEFLYTTDVNQHDFRQWEIADWIQSYGSDKVDRWVALDDEELLTGAANEKYQGLLQGHCVKTISSIGLTWQDANRAIQLLNGPSLLSVTATPSLPLVEFQHTRPPNTCRHWWKRKSCRMGEDCRFLHPDVATLPVVTARKTYRGGDNAGRFRQFREWVVATFGIHSEGNVLCVADGKGILSFDLYNVHNIPTTVVDPRPLSLLRNVKMWKSGLYHKKSDKHIKRYVPSRPPTAVPRVPRHIRAFFLPPFWENDQDDKEFVSNLYKAEHTAWTKQGLQATRTASKTEEGKEDREQKEEQDEEHDKQEEGKKHDTNVEQQSDAMNSATSTQDSNAMPKGAPFVMPDTTVRDHQTAMDIIQKCTLLLGMHPDQAAGPIVEFAVAFNKSFAVVPCCVYSDEFSKRKLQNGKRVTSYDDLCQYLIELAEPGEIQQCIIPHLKGKNVCLYRIVEGQ